MPHLATDTGIRDNETRGSVASFLKETIQIGSALSIVSADFTITSVVDAISAKAQEFYEEHFSADDPAKVTFKLAVTTAPSATGSNKDAFEFQLPVIEFGVQLDGTTVTKPQSFLNEAKLTQLALSIRFAASLVNLHESDLKLLVLDDLLVSQDMSNRMKVVDICTQAATPHAVFNGHQHASRCCTEPLTLIGRMHILTALECANSTFQSPKAAGAYRRRSQPSICEGPRCRSGAQKLSTSPLRS